MRSSEFYSGVLNQLLVKKQQVSSSAFNACCLRLWHHFHDSFLTIHAIMTSIPCPSFRGVVKMYREHLFPSRWSCRGSPHGQFKFPGLNPYIFDSVVDIATRYRLDGPAIESRRAEIFRTRPYRPWDPPSLLYSGYRVFPGGKAAGAWRWPPTSI